jgi:hypothetical protein
MIRNINRHVIPECYLDTNLVETLVPPSEIGRMRVYNHQFGCNTVAKEMKEKFSDNFAVGILDQDKMQVSYVSEFQTPLVDKQGLKLYKHPQKNHYLIFHPPIEQWLLDEAESVDLSLSDEPYNLPASVKKLVSKTKNVGSRNNPELKLLFNALKKKNAKGIILLAKWIEHLKSNPYNADRTTLQNL